MKITGNRGVGRADPARPSKTRGAASPGAAAPVDAVAVAGIPENELTPRVRAALEALMREVAALRDELAAAKDEIRDLATLADADPLLGVLNRRAFVRELSRTLAFVERYDEPAALVFIDVDDMKTVNDRHGHGAGDAALAHVAGVISDNIRRTDVFGRLGGDEFAVILTRTDEKTGIDKAAELSALITGAPATFDGQSFAVSVSFGVVPLQSGSSAQDMLGKADAAMYANKRRRKDGGG